MTHFGQRVLDYHFQLKPDWALPEGIELLYPYADPEARIAMRRFYSKYYADNNTRLLAFGINPGRFGAGVTGVPFTSPNHLLEDCGIEHSFAPSRELSSAFVYEVVHAYGGPKALYAKLYISSLCPLGFVRAGKNFNFYDQKRLFELVRSRMIAHIWAQIELGGSQAVALCLGEGQNYRYFKLLNEEAGFFKQILPLAHPRYIMQYKRKHLAAYRDKYLAAIQLGVTSM